MAATVIVPRQPFDTKIGDIVVDASIAETHVLENEITDHPVEQGANISDHSRPMPDSFTMECVVSNTPILPDAAGARPENKPGRAKATYEALKKLRDEGTLIDVVTSLVTYKSMVVKSVSIPRDAKTSDCLKFSITLKQIRVVKNKLTALVKAAAPQTHKKAGTGKQTPEDKELPGETSSKLYDLGKTGLLGKTIQGGIP